MKITFSSVPMVFVPMASTTPRPVEGRSDRG
jgi:hypothetical protein